MLWMETLDPTGAGYKPRTPQATDYFRYIQDHCEDLEMVWDDRYAARYGFWRPYVLEVMRCYLECGDLHCGFARVLCKECTHECLLPFSCKRRHFCPSCHQKRVVVFGEQVCENVLKRVPHRQWVFSIPKRRRLFFLFDRTLLAKLSRCVWRVVSEYLVQGVPYNDAVPGAVAAVQSFGNFLNFNPHLHVIVTDGCFSGEEAFMVGPTPCAKDVEALFRHEASSSSRK